MTCRRHLHLNLTRQGHIIPIKLEHTILACACIHCLLVRFPCRYLTLAPETTEETFVEISDNEPEDPGGCTYDYLCRQGGDLYHYLITFRLLYIAVA